ncbi:phytanoyl-CoA dioxygenase family protein [Granulosicoccus sp. 3-233]|uniref:phytanoyl-CoA dioxygenase family protein n=1 Tax=Granulosicoccus sp. 3-233 TaxID=3417969 RepID=UPI003D34F69C
MALSTGTMEETLSTRLVALAEEQTEIAVSRAQSGQTTLNNDNTAATTFLDLLNRVDVTHRLPLLEANTLARYQAILQSRWFLLPPLLEAASDLPIVPASPTPAREDSTIQGVDILLGSTLHHHFDSACKAVSCLIAGSPVSIEDSEAAAMTAFVSTCGGQLQISCDQLHRQLAGSVISGLMADMSAILSHPGESRQDRGVARKKLRRHLSDFLDILDVLSLQSTEHCLRFSQDYLSNDREHRARRLLETAFRNKPDCIDTRLALARLHVSLGRSQEAIQHCNALVQVRPDDLPLRRELAAIHLQRLEFIDAIQHLQHFLTLATADQAPEVERELALVESLHECETQAALPDTVPTITLTDEERISGMFNSAKLSLAEKLYQSYGTLLIHNAFSTDLIAQCREEFLHRYRRYFSDRKHSTALQIGDRRFQISLALAGAFNSPEFYANTFLLPLMKRLLGKQLIIGSTVCATSLPGSRDQHGHKDHRALFTHVPDDEPMVLPPVAVTTMIPLVSVNEDNGTTLVKKGSHHLSRRASNKLDYQVPIVPAGSCYLMDLALTHKGQGNRTDQLRPIVNMVYHRSWFVDNKNFRNQPPLQIDSVEYRRIPKEHRHLFDWAIQPGALVDTPR